MYRATKHRVLDRGAPPDTFLDELVAWGSTAPQDIFAPAPGHDIYTNVHAVLGPWKSDVYRRAAMLEVMRVLAGFETSWDWGGGPNKKPSQSKKGVTAEAGAWQVSADSMDNRPDLKRLVADRAGSTDATSFQEAMKQNHTLAMEYIARLLRRNVTHNGPVKRHEIEKWLRKDSVEEFVELISSVKPK